MHKVGVVTVTYNSRQVIDGFLTSLLAQTFSNFAVYVTDNASNDGTLERIHEYADDRVRIICNCKNMGAAEGNNQGIRAALADDCDAVLFINNDTKFDARLLATLVNGLERFRSKMAAPKILFYDDHNIIWSAGGGFDRKKGLASHLYGHGEIDTGEFDEPRLVDNAPTTCLLVRREVFETIGLLDSRYFAYVEDTDFCYRAKKAGIPILYLPSARLLHKEHSLTGGKFSALMMRYTTRNRVYFMLKHLGFARALFYLPAYQAYLLLQFVSWQIGPSMLWVREKGFFEGLRTWHQSLSD